MTAQIMYQFINIHQRTKTRQTTFSILPQYQFINIHQRTKTRTAGLHAAAGISLSISIREPKPITAELAQRICISLSISIREPKRSTPNSPSCWVSVYQYPSENQNQTHGHTFQQLYQFINIHQRTKTRAGRLRAGWAYQFINIHQRTKTMNWKGSPFL